MRFKFLIFFLNKIFWITCNFLHSFSEISNGISFNLFKFLKNNKKKLDFIKNDVFTINVHYWSQNIKFGNNHIVFANKISFFVISWIYKILKMLKYIFWQIALNLQSTEFNRRWFLFIFLGTVLINFCFW